MGGLSGDSEEWKTALIEEERARLKVLQNIDAGDEWRAWWAAVENVLRLYERVVHGHENYGPPPKEIISILKELVGYLAVGSIPGPILAARKEGAHKPGPTERLDIAIAVLYVAAAKDGIWRAQFIKIDDASPVKTAADAYGVEKRTIQKWINKYGVELFIPGQFKSATLAALMLVAGQRYQLAGRSKRAIARRDRKRGECN